MRMVNRMQEGSFAPRAVALETTLLVHGLPPDRSKVLAADLNRIIRAEGAEPALIGIVAGAATIGLNDAELDMLLRAAAESPSAVPKANTANLGVLMHWGSHAATTVSTTMELAATAGIRVFATGGLGGVHRNYGCDLDVSSDLAAFTRWPVAVVSAGVKGVLDVEATREVLETLGVTVVGFRTDVFPAFYRRESRARVDARFDEVIDLAAFLRSEFERIGATGGPRGILICNPVPPEHEVPAAEWDRWLDQAEDAAEQAGISGRDLTPFMLARLHEISGGQTVATNIELVKHNARLAAKLASAMARL